MKHKNAKNILAAFAAGLLNGLLGTGGGIPLWFSAARKEDKRSAFATSSGGVLILSLTTLFLRREECPVLGEAELILLWLSVAGGGLGVVLLSKLPIGAVRVLFAFLMIGAGVLSLTRTIGGLFHG